MEKRSEFFKEAQEITDKISETLTASEFQEELARQVFGAFLFGIVNALAYEKGESPVEVQGVMIALMVKKLKYQVNQAVKFCQELIDSTDQNRDPTIHAIIHRGIEGYYQYKEGRELDLNSNYCEILEVVLRGEY